MCRKEITPSLEVEAAILNLLGLIATSENQMSKARQYYQEAMNTWQKVNQDAEGVAVSLNGLGMVALSEGKPTDAQAKFQQAYDILRVKAAGVFGESGILPNLARAYLLQNQPEKAVPLLENAITELEMRRQRQPDLDSRALLMQLYANPCADLVQAYIALHQPDKAFDTLERLHARSFADNLTEWRLQLTQNLPPLLRDRQRELDNSRRIREKDLQRAQDRKDTAAADKAQAAIATLAAQQRQLEADIRQDYIGRIGHDIEYPQPIDLAAAQQSLPEGTLALAYAVNDYAVYLFALTNHSLTSHILPLFQKQLKQRITEARGLLADVHSTPKMCEGVLMGLYQDLLKPAQEEITHARSLLICPDGPLNLLPFAALMPSAGHYLIQYAPVTTVASLTAYRSLQASKRPPITSVLALGDPAYEAITLAERPAGTRPRLMGGVGERLPETGTLAQELKALYAPHSTALLQAQATAANFLAESGHADIVHLGCHAIADERNPFGSWLKLAPAAKGDNGRLAAWQILRTRMDARLVVLWGCGTGLGNENRFEGMQGLPRAFQTAGAANVLMTLWEVQPKETLPILRDFYRLYKQNPSGTTLAETLRQAQIKAIANHSRICDWTAFVLNGVGE